MPIWLLFFIIINELSAIFYKKYNYVKMNSVQIFLKNIPENNWKEIKMLYNKLILICERKNYDRSN